MSTSLVAVGENVQSSEYVYDHMGRLMTGSIEFVGKVGNTYAVSTSYNKVGGLLSKVSSPDASAQVFAATSQEMTYDLTYQYSGTKPHQLSEVISSQGVPYAMSFSYNASGSISEITDLVGVDHSSYYWGQEQWLCGVENTQGIHHYVYDHAGERIMKSSITQTTVQLNDETINTVTTLEPYTLYVNPYYVVTSFSNADQRSKHYYMGTQRVATDIGVDYGVSPSPEQTERARSGDDATTAGETPQGLETDQAPIQSLGYEQDLERVLLGLSGEIGVEDLSEALAPIESFYPDLSAGVNSGEGIESELPLYIGTRIMYWYHPDYVSNVDMVTDRSGEAYELFLYNAWGESLHHWSSSSTNSWSSPYRLNSKELDSETGMHYYGARYHHPKLSVWMSVDPLASERSWVSPYNFVQNNPINRVDPTGALDEWVEKDGQMMYDNRVTNQEDATALYGEGAVYRPNGYTYTASNGNNIELGDYGFFKSNGQIFSSPDLAQNSLAYTNPTQAMANAQSQIAGVRGNYTASAGVVGFISADVAIPEPTDAAWPKWAAYAVAGGVAAYYVAKMEGEIDGIMRRAGGPQGALYSLRATGSGPYTCFTCSGGTTSLNAGDVWKYGETTNPAGRYSQSQLSGWGVRQVNEFYGNQVQIKVMEKTKIYGYFLQNGHLPPGNKIFR